MIKEKYVNAIRMVAKGYLFILLNFNIETLNLIPNWIGYIMFYKSIEGISEYDESVRLLKPLTLILGIYHFFDWVIVALGFNLDIYIINVFVNIIGLYFDFQLLTNIADIAKSHGCSQYYNIYLLRNIKTILFTLLVLPIDWNQYTVIVIILSVVTLIIAFKICHTLFNYAKEESEIVGNT